MDFDFVYGYVFFVMGLFFNVVYLYSGDLLKDFCEVEKYVEIVMRFDFKDLVVFGLVVFLVNLKGNL